MNKVYYTNYMIQMDRKESKVNNLVVIFFVFCKFQNENRCASQYLFEPTLQNVVWETICRKLKNQIETCLTDINGKFCYYKLLGIIITIIG